MTHYIAINSHRSSTSEGFANQWHIYRCRDRAEQRRLLTDGLPLPDVAVLTPSGETRPITSTRGIRRATKAEIHEAEKYGAIPMLPNQD